MNWVGGIRNRIKLKQEKKLQKEFFERKRLQKKINTPNPTSVNGARSSNGSGQTISQDLFALQVIMQTHDKPVNRRKHEIRQPTRIDLERPSHFQSKKFKHEEILDLPLPSSAKPSKLEFAGALDSVTHVKPPTRGFSEPESKTEHEDCEITPSVGFNQASVTEQETCKVQLPSLGFGKDAITEHDERNLRVFELNSFENMKHSWQQTYFHDQPTSEEKPHSSKDMKRKFVSQKDDHMLFEKQQMQRAYQLGKSPFIPFAAPAPHSLAARSTSSSKRHYDLSENDRTPYCARSPPSMQRQTTQRQSFKIHDTSQGRKRDIYSTNSCSSEPEQLFLPKCIYKEKERSQNTIPVKSRDCHDLALPSPIPNEVTIECLNKSDPQSFLTDLQLLDELMENQQELGNLPDNKDVNVMESSPKPLHLEPDDDDTRLECINNPLTSSQDEPQSNEKTSTDAVWRNFIMNADHNCSNKENEEPEQNESPRENQSPKDVPISTTENAQSCRSKAAEELKEVMAVQQYESSQESSYYSSWSSTGSGNDCSRKSNTTTNSEKSPSKEAKDTKTNETKVLPNSSQELPSSSTSEQLTKNGQKQVYTLNGFSHSLKNISKDIAPRSQEPQRSNLSVFRIYPLSRSQDKSTQTENAESKMVTVDHKSVQCEIIGDNQSHRSTANFPAHERPETNCGEDPTADPNVIAVSTDEDSHTNPGQSKRESLNNVIDVPTPLNTSKDNSTQATSVMSAEMPTKVPIFPASNDLVPGTSTHATFNGHLMTSSDHRPETTPTNGDQSVSTKSQPLMTTDSGTPVTIHSLGSLADGSSRIPTEANNVLSTQSNHLPVTAPQTSDHSTLTKDHPLTTTASGTPHKSTEVNDQLTTQSDHLTPTAPQQNSDYIRSTKSTPVTIAPAIPMTTSSSVVTSKTYITAEAKDTILVTQCNHHEATAPKNSDYSSTENLSGTTNSLAAPLHSSIEGLSKHLQTRTMTNFPSTNLTLTAGTSFSVTEASGTTPHSAIQPSFPKTTDMKQTVFFSGNSELHNKKDDYQSTIKKLQEHVEQLQNINVYQSIVIKFLEM